MKGKLSGLGVAAAGALLAAAGAYAMWTGWDMILVERGWSLFIAGSVGVSGGVVTVALGRVISHLARLAPFPQALPSAAPVKDAAPVKESVPPAPARTAPQPAAVSKPEKTSPAAPAKTSAPAQASVDFSSMLEPARKSDPSQPPTEVDRYTAGEATYVMMSDGSVEVRSAAGSQRYPSLAALRAEAEARQR